MAESTKRSVDDSPLPPVAREVVEAHAGRLVTFVGSGISLFSPTNLPSWWGFITAVIRAIGGAASDIGGRVVCESILKQLNEGLLAPYQVTDILARRLGSSYLEVMPAFLNVPTNPIHAWLARSLLTGVLNAVVTTNFDRAIESAIEEQGGDLIRLTGAWETDRLLLDAQWERCAATSRTPDPTPTGEPRSKDGECTSLPALGVSRGDGSGSDAGHVHHPHRRPIVVLPTFAACNSVAHITTLLGQGTHSFIVKVHGDAGIPASCIDTEFQRMQGLPSDVTDVLTALLHQNAFMFLGFGGGDLDRDIDYLRLRSEGDQANVFWLIREAEKEPEKLFGRLRASLGERFHILRGSLAGSIDPSGSSTIRELIASWAHASVGQRWAALVLLELAAAAGLSGSQLDLLSSPFQSSTCAVTGGDALVAEVTPVVVDDVLLAAARCSDVARAPVHVTASCRNQLEIARPCTAAIAALRAGRRLDALQCSIQAVKAQRRHFPDSRLFPDAWFPLAMLGASLLECGQLEPAARFLNAARSVAELGGNLHALALFEPLEESCSGSAPQGALHPTMPTALSDAAHLSPSKAALPVPVPIPVSGHEDEVIVFLPFFDNVGSFALYGTPIATMLRAQLHRAFLTGDAVAIPPNFLLNCRPFIAEVLCPGGVLQEAYLHLIRPLLPHSTTVDYGPAGGGKHVINFFDDARPLATFRREVHEKQPAFLAERVDSSLVAAIDAFYCTHRHLIRWYDATNIPAAYGTRTLNALRRSGETSRVFASGTDRSAALRALPPTCRFVETCLDMPGGALNRSLMYRWANLFRYPVTAANFALGCAKQLESVEAQAGASAQLLDARQMLASRPWLYAPVLRDISDSAYITALPLAVGVSLVVDERDERLVQLLGTALADERKSVRVLPPVTTSPSTATPTPSLLRASELAKLSLPKLMELRNHPAAVEFRRCVARLRRRAAKAAPQPRSQASGTNGAIQDLHVTPGADAAVRSGASCAGMSIVKLAEVEAVTSLEAVSDNSMCVSAVQPIDPGRSSSSATSNCPTLTPTLAAAEVDSVRAAPSHSAFTRSATAPLADTAAISNTAAFGPDARVQAKFLRTQSTSWATASTTSHTHTSHPHPVNTPSHALHNAAEREEAHLAWQAGAAAQAYYEVLQRELTPADQIPLPVVDLDHMEFDDHGHAGSSSHKEVSETSLDSETFSARGVQARSHLQRALRQVVDGILAKDAHRVYVCKGDPIPPTFGIPMVQFPGLLPVVRPAPSYHPSIAPPTLVSTSGHTPNSMGTSGSTTSTSHHAPAAGNSGAAASATPTVASEHILPSAHSLLPPITCLERVTAYSEPANKWLQVRFDRVRFPGGSEGRHNVVVEFPGPRQSQPGVCILPFTSDGKLLLLRSYRYPVGEWSWEIPRGGPELSTPPAVQALAELEEETGYSVKGGPGGLLPLASPLAHTGALTTLWPNNGITATQVVYFAARDIEPLASGSRPEASEVIERVTFFPFEHVYDMVRDGEIRDQFTLAALSLGIIHGLLPPPRV